MRNHKMIFTLLAGLTMITTSSIYGQIIYGQPASGNVRPVYSYWSVEGDSTKTDISQLMIPMTGFIPVQENMELRFFAANASNSADYDGTEYKLSGLTDLRLQMNTSLSDDRVLLSAGLNLPTGKKKLSHDEEQPVMSILTQNYLSFPLRRLGEGFGLNVLAGVATSTGKNRLGASVMYQLNGAYEAYEGDGDYTPGNMFSVSAGIDNSSDALGLKAEVIFTTFGTDQLEGRKVFKQSDQIELRGGGIYGKKNYSFEADMRYLIRGRNERYDAEETLDYRLKVYGNELAVTGRYAYHPDQKWSLAPSFELRFISGNEFEDASKMGGAKNIGLGIDYGRTIGEGINAGLGFKYYTGSADDGNLDLSGFRLSASITTAF